MYCANAASLCCCAISTNLSNSSRLTHPGLVLISTTRSSSLRGSCATNGEPRATNARNDKRTRALKSTSPRRCWRNNDQNASEVHVLRPVGALSQVNIQALMQNVHDLTDTTPA